MHQAHTPLHDVLRIGEQYATIGAPLSGSHTDTLDEILDAVEHVMNTQPEDGYVGDNWKQVVRSHLLRKASEKNLAMDQKRIDEATQIVFSNNKTYTETADISGTFLSTVTASFNDSPWLTLELVAKGPNRRGKPVAVTYSSVEDFKKVVTASTKLSPTEADMYNNMHLTLVKKIFTNHIVQAERESWVQPTNWKFDR